MSFLKSLFSNKKSPSPGLSSNFAEDVKNAIHILGNSNDPLEDNEVLELLVSNGINRREATEIVLFLPIAFIRHWVPRANWIDEYVEFMGLNEFVTKRYCQTLAYQIIWRVTNEYFNNSPDKDTVFKIGGRRAECHGMTKLFIENPSAKVEDFIFTKTVISRVPWPAI